MADDRLNVQSNSVRVEIGDHTFMVPVKADGDATPSVAHVRDGLYSFLIQGRSISAVVESDTAGMTRATVGDHSYPLRVSDHRQMLLEALGSDEENNRHERQVKAPMPGLVLLLHVSTGDYVEVDDPLLVLEAMKMENEIRAPGDGRVAVIHVSIGDAVARGTVLLEIEPTTESP